jgi:hypothetical protein
MSLLTMQNVFNSSGKMLRINYNQTWIHTTDYNTSAQYQISRKSVLWEASCSIRAERRTGTTKLVVTFRNYADASKTVVNSECIPCAASSVITTEQ